MALEVQNGRAVLYGIRNNGTPIQVEGYGSIIVDTAKQQHKFKMENVEDELGFDTALIATNSHVEVDLTWVPSGTTRAEAETISTFLEPLAPVALSGFAIAFFNDNWIYVGDGSIDLSHKAGKMSIKLRKYSDPEQHASLSTRVTETTT